MDIKELQNLRDKHTTGIFWLGLGIAAVFLVPALLAVYFGKKLNAQFEVSYFTNILLALAFIISWVIVGFQYKNKTKILRNIESQIVELRKKEELANKTEENI